MIERRHAPVLAGLAKSISEGGGKSPEELELAVRQIVSRAISSDKLLGKVKHRLRHLTPALSAKECFSPTSLTRSATTLSRSRERGTSFEAERVLLRRIEEAGHSHFV